MAFMQNQWFVAIVASIASGIIVHFVTAHWARRGQDRMYMQRVESANREIVAAFRPSVADRLPPTREVLDALIASIARRHSVRVETVYTAKEVAEELVSEVVESSFVSAEDKENLCGMLIELAQHPIAERSALGNASRMRVTRSSSATGAMSLGLAVTTALATLALSLTRLPRDLGAESPFVASGLIIPVVLVIASLFGMMIASIVLERKLARGLRELGGLDGKRRRHPKLIGIQRPPPPEE